MDDRRIIFLFYSRDEQAIAETDKKYGKLCKSIASNLLCPQDAEECVNDGYHVLWNKIPPAFPISLKAFLGRIIRDLAISRFRENRAQKRYGITVLLSELNDCIPSSAAAESGIEQNSLTNSIASWLRAQLPESRDLFVKRYWYGYSVEALAKKLDTTPAALSQRLYRLRISLKNYLAEEGVNV